MNLTPDLARAQSEIEGYAREYGLDFFTTIFELVDHDQLNEIAAFGGFPVRYPHWRFGMEFDRLQKGYTYGLSKIYELVINNDPCYAYLMKSNSLVDQKLVMAHVYGHCDFFKNNAFFAPTDRKMMDRMANHGTIIRKAMEEHGVAQVEDFVDHCLSLDNLVDIHSNALRRPWEGGAAAAPTAGAVGRLPAKGYMDRFINPTERLAEERERARLEKSAKERVPAQPQRDVLRFLLDHAPLARWEQEILGLVREEAYYFAPQGQTKIMNEGWASYWHSTLMTQRILRDSEVVDFADHHAGTVCAAPGQLNPYKLGIELFRDIERRWNQGRHGPEFEACDDLRQRDAWDSAAGEGREKIFEVRRVHNDITFVDTFMNQAFCDAQKFYAYRTNPRTGEREIASRDHRLIKEQILFGLSNSGNPVIEVQDGNYRNRGEMLLTHRFGGLELDLKHARETLRALEALWRRPVHLETRLDEDGVVLHCVNGELDVETVKASAETEPFADSQRKVTHLVIET